MVVLLRRSGWRVDDVAGHLAHLPQRLEECGIELGPIDVVETDVEIAPADDWPAHYRALTARIPQVNGLLLLFVDMIDVTGIAHDYGGAAFCTASSDPGGRSFAVIARRSPSGHRYRSEQRVAHELGHLLGLSHASRVMTDNSPRIDLMHPRGCLYCAFTAEQCAKLLKHPLVLPLKP